MAEKIEPNVDLDGSDVYVGVSEYQGKTYIEIRKLWQSPLLKDGGWARTRKGINLEIDNIPILVEAMLALYNEHMGSNYMLVEK